MKIEILPSLSDNYIFIISNSQLNNCIIIDPSDGDDVLSFCAANNLQIKFILNTHHHHDHIGGNRVIQEATNCKIIAPKYDEHRIGNIDIKVKDHDKGEVLGFGFEVIYIPGHTLGHIAYYFPKEKILFCGDTIFSGGCGRIFEGTYEQMFSSISRLKALPEETKIYCAHEYTINNLKFALSVDPNNQDLVSYHEHCKSMREQNIPTIPTNLTRELKINPFLRARTVDEFSKLRKLKDVF